jgi:membrane fusion protein (multidrug efflux system)
MNRMEGRSRPLYNRNIDKRSRNSVSTTAFEKAFCPASFPLQTVNAGFSFAARLGMFRSNGLPPASKIGYAMEEKSATNQPAPAPRPPVSESSSVPPPRRRFKVGYLFAAVIGLVLIAAAVFFYVRFVAPYEETDDAFIESYVAFISPRVSGPVVKLRITDNQRVKAGDVLLEIDPRDYQVVVDQANADLAAANSRVQQAEAQIVVDQAKADQQKAAVAAAQAIADRTEADRARYEAVQSQAVSRSQFDLATTAASSAVAEVEVARNQAKAAVAQVDLDRAEVETARTAVQQAQTRLAQAQLQLSYTTVVAPRDGKVTRRTVEQGAYVQTGEALLALVPDEIWVVANFKETQLENMRPGQPVLIRVDAYPQHKFKGKVDSLQAGSGARFSLLPPENAVGNYVKVVQRVPVKIVFDEPIDLSQLDIAPGLSVVPKVRVK